MKRSLLLTVLFFALISWTSYSFAQCTPDPLVIDTIGDGAMAPDTLLGTEGVPMNVTLSIICPTTADVGAGSIPIHHITIKSITNKPAWLSYACNPGNCEYAAGALQCALVTGTPPAGSAGTVSMNVLVDVYMNLGGTPIQVATDYNSGDALILIVTVPSSVAEQDGSDFNIIASRPNPFKNDTRIGCYTASPQKVDLKVVDILGSIVCTETIFTTQGDNYFVFNGDDLRPGVYFYSITDENQRILTRKMLKSE